MSQRSLESVPYRPQVNCCICIEINRGMQLMGWLTVMNSIWMLVVAGIHIAEDRWLAQIYLPLMIPSMLLAYFYC